MDKLMGSLSLCRKAGKLVMGFDAVAQSITKGRAAALLLACDLSEGSAKRITRTAQQAGLTPLRLPLTQQQLTAVTPKPTGIFAVEDPGLAKLVTDRLARQGTPQRADDEESN